MLTSYSKNFCIVPRYGYWLSTDSVPVPQFTQYLYFHLMLRSNNASEAWNARFNRTNNGQRQSFWRLLRQLRRYRYLLRLPVHLPPTPTPTPQKKQINRTVLNYLGRRSGHGWRFKWPSWTSVAPRGGPSGDSSRPRTQGRDHTGTVHVSYLNNTYRYL